MLEELQRRKRAGVTNEAVVSRKKFTRTKKVGDVWSRDYVDFIINYWKASPRVASSLREMKSRLSNIRHELNRPDIVIRFVIHCGEDPAAAEALFRQMLEWRQANRVDEMFGNANPYKPDPLILRYYPGAILAGKGDHQGDPIFLSRMGVTDLGGMLARFGHDEMIKFEIWKRESGSTGQWIQQWEEQNQRPIQRIVIIEDMHGLSRKQLMSSGVLQLYGEVMKLDQDNFCECSKKIIIIRAPTLFRFAWAIGKRFFPQHIIDKMEFTSEANYLEVLSSYMDINDLPPCIYAKGKGKAIPGMSTSFEGGIIPAAP